MIVTVFSEILFSLPGALIEDPMTVCHTFASVSSIIFMPPYNMHLTDIVFNLV